MAAANEPDLTNQTPVDIDTSLAALYANRAGSLRKVADNMDRMLIKVRPNNWRREAPRLGHEEILELTSLAIKNPETTDRDRNSLNDYLERYDSARDEIDNINDEIEMYDNEFDRRGGWTRAFLVTNAGGHVHRSMGCSSCFPTTQYAWMTDYSGGTEDAVVEDAGERACTVCYPSAPVETLNRPTKMFTEDEKQAQIDREARAAAKVERDAKKLAKAILPSGEDLKIPSWQNPSGKMHYDRIQSLVAARTRMTDLCEDWRAGSDADREAKKMLSEAIAAKEGKTVAQVLEEATKRAAKRK